MDLCRFGGGGVQSSDDDYLMNGTIDGNPPPGHDALLFSISGTGCLVAQTRLDIYQGLYLPSHGPLGEKSKCFGTRQIRTADLSVHSLTREPPDHDDRPKSEDLLYPGSSTGGSSPYWGWGSSAKTQV